MFLQRELWIPYDKHPSAWETTPYKKLGVKRQNRP